ncbi:MAG TPA: DUF1854 domain-containing protein [Fimbriimonadaceae bacterium]|nr:DUF1854 domain-containing protein [Fimbriimonadaceae bacterium]
MSASAVNYLTPAQVRIMTAPGAAYARVEVVDDRCILGAQFKRVFPLTNPDTFISIQDQSDHEVGILESLDGMPPDQKEIILHELDRRYFTPVVERIEELKQDAGMWKFVVQTQRGPAEFYVRNWRDSAHEASRGRWQILSVDGLRFEIRQVETLDERSQVLLEQLF